jgi:hypothetical protein
MTFDSGTMTNAKLTGPITMNGTGVTMITSDAADMRGFNLSRIGLTTSDLAMSGLAIYAVNITAYSPELGKTIQVGGGDQVSLGPYTTITFKNATMQIVRMSADSANLTAIEVTGEYVGGAEPYIPTIISAPSVTMTNGYSLLGPVTYDGLQNRVHNFTMGTCVVTQLSLTHPISYSLDRGHNTFTSVDKWAVTAYNATMTNLGKDYLQYVAFNAYGILVVTLTGEDDPSLESGYNVGYGGTVMDASMHIVYAQMEGMTLRNLLVGIV